MIIKNIKNYFKKPSMPIIGTLLLGFNMVLLIVIAETNNGYYRFIHVLCNALLATIILALCVQIARLYNEL